MSTDVSIITVDNSDNLTFGTPLKVADFEINPSGGGVLKGGVPYQGGGSGPVGSNSYFTIRKELTSDHNIGSADLDVGIPASLTVGKKKFFITVGPPEKVLPGTTDFIESQIFNIQIIGLQDPVNPPFAPIFYSNMYSSGSVIAPFTTYVSQGILVYRVTVNYPDSIYSMVDGWMVPADCGLFMELIPV